MRKAKLTKTERLWKIARLMAMHHDWDWLKKTVSFSEKHYMEIYDLAREPRRKGK